MTNNLHRYILFCSFLVLHIFTKSALAQEIPIMKKIGVIGAFTGEAAAYGYAFRNGINLAFEELNKEKQSSIEFIFEDDQLKPSLAILAAQKLINVNKVDGVICLFSNTCKAIVTHTEKNKIPLIAVGSDSSIVKNKNYSYMFWVTPEKESEVLVPEIEKKNFKKIALVTTIQDGMLANKKSFKEKLSSSISLIYDNEFASTDKDFRSALLKIKALAPDAVCIFLMPGQVGIFAKQLRQLGLTMPLFGNEGLEDKSEFEASNGALENAWFVSGSSGTEEFQKRFKSKYKNSILVPACNGYDSFSILSGYLTSSFRDFNHYVNNLGFYDGACGKFDVSSDKRFNLPAVIKLINSKGDSVEIKS
jgi:branched-chain amino acid transport system substrate-binding protein